MEFLSGASRVRRARRLRGLRGVVEDLTQNVASLGFDLAQLEADGRLVVDHINVSRQEVEETGEWDLDGPVPPPRRCDRRGRRKAGRDRHDGGALRCLLEHRSPASELRRLLLWLKDRGVTAVITGERGDGTLTRHGIEEYVSDCVIVLDHRVTEQTSIRRLRILKYRGSLHGTNEYPFPDRRERRVGHADHIPGPPPYGVD
jgi:circadian clock protein KaiC